MIYNRIKASPKKNIAPTQQFASTLQTPQSPQQTQIPKSKGNIINKSNLKDLNFQISNNQQQEILDQSILNKTHLKNILDNSIINKIKNTEYKNKKMKPFNYKSSKDVAEEFRILEELMSHESRYNSLKYKQLLTDLKSNDDIKILDAITQLSTELSMAQEDNLGGFQLDILVPVLINCLQKDSNPDIMRNFSFLPLLLITINIHSTLSYMYHSHN